MTHGLSDKFINRQTVVLSLGSTKILATAHFLLYLLKRGSIKLGPRVYFDDMRTGMTISWHGSNVMLCTVRSTLRFAYLCIKGTATRLSAIVNVEVAMSITALLSRSVFRPKIALWYKLSMTTKSVENVYPPTEVGTAAYPTTLSGSLVADNS